MIGDLEQEEVAVSAVWTEERPDPPRRSKALQLAGLGLLLVVGFWQFAEAGFDWRVVLKEQDPWVFLFAMATLPVLGFPISACYIFAGMAFNVWTAIAVCLVGLAVNMSLSFALTHSFLKEPIERFAKKRGWKIPKLTGDNAFRFAFLIRTVPGPPFLIQNLALGLSGIPFWSYLGISLLTQGTIAVGVIYCTSVLSKDPGSVGAYAAIAVVALLLVLKSARWIAKRRKASAQLKH